MLSSWNITIHPSQPKKLKNWNFTWDGPQHKYNIFQVSCNPWYMGHSAGWLFQRSQVRLRLSLHRRVAHKQQAKQNCSWVPKPLNTWLFTLLFSLCAFDLFYHCSFGFRYPIYLNCRLKGWYDANKLRWVQLVSFRYSHNPYHSNIPLKVKFQPFLYKSKINKLKECELS